MSSEMKSTSPPVRRVVTGHTAEGKSFFAEDSSVDLFAFPSSTGPHNLHSPQNIEIEAFGPDESRRAARILPVLLVCAMKMHLPSSMMCSWFLAFGQLSTRIRERLEFSTRV